MQRAFTLMQGAVPPRHVAVTIVGATRKEMAAGVSWPANGVLTRGGKEGPFEVGVALLRAEVVARAYGFPPPLVWMERPELWQAQWGTLIRPPVTHEPLAEITSADLSDPEWEALFSQLGRESDS